MTETMLSTTTFCLVAAIFSASRASASACMAAIRAAIPPTFFFGVGSRAGDSLLRCAPEVGFPSATGSTVGSECSSCDVVLVSICASVATFEAESLASSSSFLFKGSDFFSPVPVPGRAGDELASGTAVDIAVFAKGSPAGAL